LIARMIFAATGLVASYVVSPDISHQEPVIVHFEHGLYHDNYQIPSIPPDYSLCGTDRNRVVLDIAYHAYRAGFEYNELVTAVSVAMAESDGDPEARAVNRNRSTDSGLWQINSVHGFSGLKDPQTNAEAAFHVWSFGGWSAWYAHTPRGGEYGSGPLFRHWHPIVECLLTLSPDYGTLVPHNDTGE